MIKVGLKEKKTRSNLEIAAPCFNITKYGDSEGR